MGLFRDREHKGEVITDFDGAPYPEDWQEVVRFHREAELGKPIQRERARASLIARGEAALEPLLWACSYRGLLSAVEAAVAIGPGARRMVLAEIEERSARAAFATHLLAHLAACNVPEALDSLQWAAHRGEDEAGDPRAAALDSVVRSVAQFWLAHHFKEPDRELALSGGLDGARLRMWLAQGRPISDWPRCYRCGGFFERKRPLVRAVQCPECGLIYAEPTYEPQVSHEPRTWGQLAGVREWRPFMAGEIEFWGLTKAWAVNPPGLTALGDCIIAYPMLKEPSGEEEAAAE